LYALEENILDENLNTINRNAEALPEGTREVRLEVNTERTKYLIVSSHQYAGHTSN
jgi:hypothetical protein